MFDVRPLAKQLEILQKFSINFHRLLAPLKIYAIF